MRTDYRPMLFVEGYKRILSIYLELAIRTLTHLQKEIWLDEKLYVLIENLII